MKSIQRNFNATKAKYSDWSSYACFAGAVKGKRFGREAIRRWFNKLVEKGDYARSEKKAMLENLERLSNPMRTPENQGKTHQG